MKLRKYFFTIIFSLFLILLIVYSNTNIIAAKNGIILWAEAIVPSLLPFFIASNLFCKTNIVEIFGKLLSKIMRPLFNQPGEAFIAIFTGIVSGYPVGAKTVCNLIEENKITLEEAEKLVAFCNNSGPLFILGTVGISMFSNKTIGIKLLIVHILASFTVGVIFKYWSPKTLNKLIHNYSKNEIEKNYNSANITLSSLGYEIGESITSSILSILLVGGFVMLFSVILSILKNSHVFDFCILIDNYLNLSQGVTNSIFEGIIELTNGLHHLTNIDISGNLQIIIASGILGFGGISVMLQVYSIIAKYKLSIKPYIIGKIFQSIISMIYIYIALYL